MMLLLYSLMLISLLLAWFHSRATAITFYAITLILAIGWFLFHVYNPQYGFRTPWIQTHKVIHKKGGTI